MLSLAKTKATYHRGQKGFANWVPRRKEKQRPNTRNKPKTTIFISQRTKGFAAKRKDKKGTRLQ
ncbi:MAG: hypothetical protein ACI936_002807 [Paraglaciecola sp.]|jgi:hypothetical protein